MPIYSYQILNEDGTEGEIFEIMRKMSDPELKKHPDTGQKVKRIFTAPHIAGLTNSLHDTSRLSDKNLEKNGFTTYRKNGKGHYDRTTGTAGPDHLSAD
jgi:predicted nucleic acid-binding Zn ribbon protein